MKAIFLVILVSVLAALSAPMDAFAALADDPRYCGGEPARTPDGRIKRSGAALRAFVRVFPCPATLEVTLKCPGWAIDHTIPLADGGCDKPVNMTWLPNALKNCAGTVCKDRWERKYHASPRIAVPMVVEKGA
jgi:hypothetical protein